ncbi:MAG: hypothetical protein WD469_03185 [Paenibacillaceae bacterium]
MTMQNPTIYHNKLLDIQQALTLVDTDRLLIVTICHEMVFLWVPEILDHLVLLMDENRQLQVDNNSLNLQNDSLLKQNIELSQRLNHL